MSLHTDKNACKVIYINYVTNYYFYGTELWSTRMYVCVCMCLVFSVYLNLCLFQLFRLLASLESTKTRLYFYCSICCDLLLLSHKKSTKTGLNLGSTSILHRLSILLLSILLQPFLHRALLLLLLASKCTRAGARLSMALGTVSAATAAAVGAGFVEAIQLFAHTITTKSRLYLNGCTFLRLQRWCWFWRARIYVHDLERQSDQNLCTFMNVGRGGAVVTSII